MINIKKVALKLLHFYLDAMKFVELYQKVCMKHTIRLKIPLYRKIVPKYLINELAEGIHLSFAYQSK